MLLIVRELLVGSRRYSQIRAALPGIATNLLADRLRALQADGIITRDEGEGRYHLTPFGRELEKVVHELVRWGARWMGQRGPNEEFRPEWLAVALGALVPRRRSGRVEIHADDAVINIVQGRVSVGYVDNPDVVIEGSAEKILGVAAGRAPLSDLVVQGDQEMAAAAMARR